MECTDRALSIHNSSEARVHAEELDPFVQFMVENLDPLVQFMAENYSRRAHRSKTRSAKVLALLLS